jgi:hypothetical protein
MKKEYLKEKRKCPDDGDVKLLPHKKRGRRLCLGRLWIVEYRCI